MTDWVDWYIVLTAIAGGTAGAALVFLAQWLYRERLRGERSEEYERTTREATEEAYFAAYAKARYEAETRAASEEAYAFRKQARDKATCDLRCFYCGFAKYYQDLRGPRFEAPCDEAMAPVELCRRCGAHVKWETAAEEAGRGGMLKCNLPPDKDAFKWEDPWGDCQSVPTETIATEAIPTKTTAPVGKCAVCGCSLSPPNNVTCSYPACIMEYHERLKRSAVAVDSQPPPPAEEKGPCKRCGGRMVFGDLSFCPDCTKHIRPMPFVLDLQGELLSKAAIVDFARIVGWHRIACWTSHRDALLGMPDIESNWARPDEASAMLRDRSFQRRGMKDILFGRPIRTTDYAPTDRLLSYDLAGDWTGQIINIGTPAPLPPMEETVNAQAIVDGARKAAQAKQKRVR